MTQSEIPVPAENKTYSMSIVAHGSNRLRGEQHIKAADEKSVVDMFRKGGELFGAHNKVFGFSVWAVDNKLVDSYDRHTVFIGKLLTKEELIADLARKDAEHPLADSDISREQRLNQLVFASNHLNATMMVMSNYHRGITFIEPWTDITVYSEKTGDVLFDQAGPFF